VAAPPRLARALPPHPRQALVLLMLTLSASALLVLPVLLLLPFSSRLALKAKHGYQLTDIPETFMDFLFCEPFNPRHIHSKPVYFSRVLGVCPTDAYIHLSDLVRIALIPLIEWCPAFLICPWRHCSWLTFTFGCMELLYCATFYDWCCILISILS
jgi:hypothetical protein